MNKLLQFVLLVSLVGLSRPFAFSPRPFLPSTRLNSEPAPPPIDDERVSLSAATDAAMDKQAAAAARVAELKSQEVFIKRSKGIHQCKNCNYEYVESLGSTEIGGEFPPGTPFSSLPSNYRCPTCRASKDSFFEVTEEVAGFAVNQGYGFGTNGMTGGEKNTLIFGTLGALFVLMLGGYGLS